MRIAICEDLPGDAQALSALVRQYCDGQHIAAEIDGYESAEALLSAYRPGGYQIVFMDIFLGGASGMEAARAIRQTDDQVALIFTTISPDFAVDSYYVDAAFYLVKPVSPDGLGQAMGRCRQLIERHAKTLRIFQNRKAVDIRLGDILYVETQRNDRVIHTRTGAFLTRIPLVTLAQDLGGPPFVRCHNSFIVNLSRVNRLDGRDFVLEDEVRIPVSKAYFASAQTLFYAHRFGEARGQP